MTALILFIIGLSVGSFLNAFAYRIANDRPWINGRSFCPHCKNELAGWQLIPLLSFIILRARCFYCKKPISWQYPTVELATGLSFVLAFFYISNPYVLVIGIALSVLLIFIALYDFRELQILDLSVLLAVILGSAIAYLKGQFIISVLSGVALSAFFYGIYKLSKGKWIGFGDVKLGFALGLINGPLVITTLVFASWLGTLVGLSLIILKQANLKTHLPFGTFLAVACVFVLIFEPYLQNYLSMLFL